MNGINVLSLFDGMSCGQIALKRVGIGVDKYFASEIDKYAIKVTENNYPNTIQIGDINHIYYKEHGQLVWGKPQTDEYPRGYSNVKIDLIIGGSPCQGFSFAGKQLNFNDPRSKLFFEFVRLLNEIQPKYFLLENVRMKKEHQDIISKELNVEPILIDSTLVSAQSRKRLYWTNIVNITKLKDKGIFIKDIWDGGEKITKKVLKKLLGTLSHKNTWKNMVTLNDKSKCLTAVGQNISNTSCTNININGEYYKLTPLCCERLQTVPEEYTKGVSNTQRYKMLGNGWTVDIIAHILKNIL